jgi:hypothetical protein
MVLGRLRSFIRQYFTRVEYVGDEHPVPLTARRARTRSKRCRPVYVSPSERFVWGMVILIVALIGLIVMETAYIVVTGKVNTEMLMVISGLVGALSSTFLMGKKS